MITDFLKAIAIQRFGSLEEARYNERLPEINLRCPICGDSAINKTKSRFWYNTTLGLFNCFNCNPKSHTTEYLFSLYPNLPNFDYKKFTEYLNDKVIFNYLNPTKKEQNYIKNQKEDLNVVYPPGALLSLVIKKENYLYLDDEDKVLLRKVITMLTNRKIKPNWFHYFYFVFAGHNLSNYILTLSEYNRIWLYSGRKIDDNMKTLPKYYHLKNSPMSEMLGFSNEISIIKGNRIYICESWFSALILNQCGYNSVCCFGIKNMKYDHPTLNKYRKQFELIWIPDQDDTFFPDDVFYDPFTKGEFCQMNKQYRNLMKIKIIPDKDPNDMLIRLGTKKFKKEFNIIPEYTLYDSIFMNNKMLSKLF